VGGPETSAHSEYGEVLLPGSVAVTAMNRPEATAMPSVSVKAAVPSDVVITAYTERRRR
jgi:hypothetical protein